MNAGRTTGEAKLNSRIILFALLIFGVSPLALGLAPFSETAVVAQTESADPNRPTQDGKVKIGPQDSFRAMMLTSQAFRDAARKIQPALVTIESFGGVGTSQGRIGGIRKQGEGNTTGVMISPDGYVLTSTFNFIQHPPVITVITSDGETRIAKLVGRDDTRKLCLLKIEGVAEMHVPLMVEVEEIQVGQWAVSLGVGYGDASPALSMGIVSAKNRIGGRAIQTDANISPANYGGPLIDINGRMLGICVPMNPTSQAVGAGVEWYDSGIGFAIPLAGAQELIERLKKGEQISPPFIGIVSTPNPDGDGMLITEVLKASPADAAGIHVNDMLLKLNGQSVNDMLRLRQILNRFESGESIKLTIERKQEQPDPEAGNPAKEDPQDDDTHQTGDTPQRSLLKGKQEVEILLGSPPRPKGELDRLKPPEIR